MMQGCELIASLKTEYLILDFKNTLKGSPITGKAGDLACEKDPYKTIRGFSGAALSNYPSNAWKPSYSAANCLGLHLQCNHFSSRSSQKGNVTVLKPTKMSKIIGLLLSWLNCHWKVFKCYKPETDKSFSSLINQYMQCRWCKQWSNLGFQVSKINLDVFFSIPLDCLARNCFPCMRPHWSWVIRLNLVSVVSTSVHGYLVYK